jgi:hypothetical protein
MAEGIDSTDDVMIFLPGPVAAVGRKRSFRCECGCNVFRRCVDKANRYICNACKAYYIGEA